MIVRTEDIILLSAENITFGIGKIRHPQLQQRQLLCQEELNNIADAVDQRKEEFIAGRVLAKKIYTKLVDNVESLSDVHILKGNLGEPIITDTNVLISISHHDDMVIACAAKDFRGIGIDIHKKTKFGNEADLFLSNKELRILENKNENFNIAWTAKESYVKYCKHGLELFEMFEIADVKQKKYWYEVYFENIEIVSFVIPYGEFYISLAINKYEDYKIKSLIRSLNVNKKLY